SSSLKVALYEDETAIASGAVEGIGRGEGRLTVRDGSAGLLRDERGVFSDAGAALRDAFGAAPFPAPDAAGRRIVPVGADPAAPGHRPAQGAPPHPARARGPPALPAGLGSLVPPPPLPLPAPLDGIEAVPAQFPRLPQAACFDPAFHRRMPAVAQRLPLPRAF